MKRLTFLLGLLSILTFQVFGQFDDPFAPDKITVKQHISHKAVKPGETFQILTEVTVIDGWKAYYKNPGAPGLPVKLTFDESRDVEMGATQWQTPYSKKVATGEDNYLYKNTFYLLTNGTVNSSTEANTTEIKSSIRVQICDAKGCDNPVTFTPHTTLQIGDSTQADSKVQEKIQSILPKLITKDENLKVKATVKELDVTLEIETDLTFNNADNVHFISDNGNNDPAIKQTVKKTDKGYSIHYKLAEDHNLKDTILGVITNPEAKLTDSISGIEISTAVTGEVKEAVAKAGGHFLTFSPEEIAAHAELYNVDEKINYVTLSDEPPAEKTFATIMFFAFAGGMLLNLMPCVFPVLGLKVMGFAQLAGDDPKKIKMHGLVFTFGVVVSMWVLGGIILAIRAGAKAAKEGAEGGAEVTWGEQMQSPIFVGCMIILFFIMGLNMYGVFEIGTKLTSAGGDLQNKKGYQGSFFSGILTTLVATPCSGPFLGVAMTYTLGAPAPTAILLFTIFSLGISFPYLLLAFVPALINKLPQPGAWMEVMKKFMAFPLFGTAVFFLNAFGGQTGVTGVVYLSMALVLFGMAAWAYGTWSLPYIAKKKRIIWGFCFPIIILTAAVLTTNHAMKQKGSSQLAEGFQKWHPGLVEHHLKKKKMVWVDYTADW